MLYSTPSTQWLITRLAWAEVHQFKCSRLTPQALSMGTLKIGFLCVSSWWLCALTPSSLRHIFITLIAFSTILALMALLYYWTALTCTQYVKRLRDEKFLVLVLRSQSFNITLIVKVASTWRLTSAKCLVTGVFKSLTFPELGTYSIQVTPGSSWPRCCLFN